MLEVSFFIGNNSSIDTVNTVCNRHGVKGYIVIPAFGVWENTMEPCLIVNFVNVYNLSPLALVHLAQHLGIATHNKAIGFKATDLDTGESLYELIHTGVDYTSTERENVNQKKKNTGLLGLCLKT